MIAFLSIDLAGLICGLLLFWRRRLLPRQGLSAPEISLSVIIPARNEASNLPVLLASLARQTRRPDEIIVADDDSSDQTAAIARAHGVRVLSLRDKPPDWLGKSWACQQGAEAASGDLLLFLDADVELGAEAIARLLATRPQGGAASVLPYHQVRRPYEYLSVFFNLVQIAGNGSGLPFNARHAGLFGPAVLIGRADYQKIGGHRAVHGYVVEDLALGRALARNGIPDHLYYGDGDVNYRMYSEGARQLARGWMKNMVAGASQAPAHLLIMASLWITGCLGCVVDTIRILASSDLTWLPASLALIILFWLQVTRATRQAGNFHPLAMVIYPVWLLAFLVIFLLAVAFRLLGLKVIWKDRKVSPCK